MPNSEMKLTARYEHRGDFGDCLRIEGDFDASFAAKFLLPAAPSGLDTFSKPCYAVFAQTSREKCLESAERFRQDLARDGHELECLA